MVSHTHTYRRTDSRESNGSPVTGHSGNPESCRHGWEGSSTCGSVTVVDPCVKP